MWLFFDDRARLSDFDVLFFGVEFRLFLGHDAEYETLEEVFYF